MPICIVPIDWHCKCAMFCIGAYRKVLYHWCMFEFISDKWLKIRVFSLFLPKQDIRKRKFALTEYIWQSISLFLPVDLEGKKWMPFTQSHAIRKFTLNTFQIIFYNLCRYSLVVVRPFYARDVPSWNPSACAIPKTIYLKMVQVVP